MKTAIMERLVFFHIPKTAGTSITSALEHWYPPEHRFRGRTMLDYQEESFESLKEYRFFGGHVFWNYIQSTFPNDFHFCSTTVLRDPITRAISLYRFWRNTYEEMLENKVDNPILLLGPRLAHSMSLLEFVYSDHPFVHRGIQNAQVRQLCQHSKRLKLGDGDLRSAGQNLNKIDVVGVQDKLESYWSALRQRMDKADAPQLATLNASKESTPLWENLRQKADIIAQLKRRNTLDQALYGQAIKRSEKPTGAFRTRAQSRSKVRAAVIVLNYNGEHLLKRFLPSVSRAIQARRGEAKLYVVDNASTDGSLTFLEGSKGVTVLKNTTNRMWAGGNNDGAKMAKKDHPDLEWLIFLNNDVEVPLHFLDAFLRPPRAIETASIIGVKAIFAHHFAPLRIRHSWLPSAHERRGTLRMTVASQQPDVLERLRCNLPQTSENQFLLDRDTEIRIPVLPQHPSPLTLTLRHNQDFEGRIFVRVQTLSREYRCRIGFGQKHEIRILPNQNEEQQIINNAGSYIDIPHFECGDIGYDEVDIGQYDDPRFVDAVCGVSMGIKVSAFETLQGFDENYQLYFEDSDFSARAIAAGLRCAYNPSVTVRHLHSATAKTQSLKRETHIIRSRVLFNRRFLTPKAFKTWFSTQLKLQQEPKLRAALEGAEDLKVQTISIDPKSLSGRQLLRSPSKILSQA